MNLQKFNKKRSGRGMRGRTVFLPKANIIHLSRILLFLRRNKGKFYARKQIGENTCTGFGYVDSALKFLEKEKLVKSKMMKGYSNAYTKVLKYSIS